MKTLASCNPKEFLIQTNKIRKSLADWLTATKVLEIRKNLPEIAADASPEDRQRLLNDQMQKNLTAMLDAILEEKPDKTAELLCLLCFTDPKDMEKHKMTEFFSAIAEMLGSKEVLDFFVSLARLGQMNISGIAKA